MRFSHLSTTPLNLDASLAFWRDTMRFEVLPMPVRPDAPRSAVLKFGTLRLVLTAPVGTRKSDGRFRLHLASANGDIEAHRDPDGNEVILGPALGVLPEGRFGFDHLFGNATFFDRTVSFWEGLGLTSSPWPSAGDQPRGNSLAHATGLKVTVAERHDAEDSSWDGGVNADRYTVHVRVQNADTLYKELGGGAHVVVKPERAHWGVRWFVVRDPEDNRIGFFHPVG